MALRRPIFLIPKHRKSRQQQNKNMPANTRSMGLSERNTTSVLQNIYKAFINIDDIIR